MENLTIYIPGTDSESEFIHMATGFVEPVVIKDKKKYYALNVRDHKSYIKNIKELVARRGYFISDRSVLADSCSIESIAKAVKSVYENNSRYIQDNFTVDVIDAEKKGTLGQNNKALIKYKNRLFHLIVVKYSDLSEMPGGTPIHCNPHDDVAVIEQLKSVLSYNGYFDTFEPYYSWGITELIEYGENI
ncbi:MAG: hypothetical protein IJA55_00940 [Clostridia bacterium]|nr:hypothetical protein [Clostridia bacterium]